MMVDCSNIRYRTEVFAGSGEREAAKVMAYETFELGNTDILETMLEEFLQDKPELSEKCQAFIDELGANGYVDDLSTEDGVAFFKDVLDHVSQKTGVAVQYVLWLADLEAVTDRTWYGKDLYDIDVDVESYLKGPVVLSDLGYDGTLYGYPAEPISLERQLEELKLDTLVNIIDEREGVRDGSKRALWLDEEYCAAQDRIAELEEAIAAKFVKVQGKEAEVEVLLGQAKDNGCQPVVDSGSKDRGSKVLER